LNYFHPANKSIIHYQYNITCVNLLDFQGGPDETVIYSVGELNHYVRDVIGRDPLLHRIWVKGEISNLVNHGSGHKYFTLKDRGAQLSCVMFRNYCKNLAFEPESGMKVLVLGDIDVYEVRGNYQLVVTALKPDGIGDLHRALEILKKKLSAQGLFDAEHKKLLPRFPGCIGVATSPTGAVVHDIINVTRRRFPVNILVAPTIVQGEMATESIVSSIERLNQMDVDVIILARGGGSLEDLWPFNSEAVAWAIFNSHVPVVSAVGHETDFTIADLAADVRAPTPSAAAELVVPDRKEVKNQIDVVKSRLVSSIFKPGIINVGIITVICQTSSSVLFTLQYILPSTTRISSASSFCTCLTVLTISSSCCTILYPLFRIFSGLTALSLPTLDSSNFWCFSRSL